MPINPSLPFPHPVTVETSITESLDAYWSSRPGIVEKEASARSEREAAHRNLDDLRFKLRAGDDSVSATRLATATAAADRTDLLWQAADAALRASEPVTPYLAQEVAFVLQKAIFPCEAVIVSSVGSEAPENVTLPCLEVEATRAPSLYDRAYVKVALYSHSRMERPLPVAEMRSLLRAHGWDLGDNGEQGPQVFNDGVYRTELLLDFVRCHSLVPDLSGFGYAGWSYEDPITSPIRGLARQLSPQLGAVCTGYKRTYATSSPGGGSARDFSDQASATKQRIVLLDRERSNGIVRSTYKVTYAGHLRRPKNQADQFVSQWSDFNLPGATEAKLMEHAIRERLSTALDSGTIIGGLNSTLGTVTDFTLDDGNHLSVEPDDGGWLIRGHVSAIFTTLRADTEYVDNVPRLDGTVDGDNEDEPLDDADGEPVPANPAGYNPIKVGGVVRAL